MAMFKTGTIRKVEVKNFVTYSHVEFIPGPNLNMILGPNGTGKSTIVAAIILGLGGNPKTVGRGTKISEYVKHTCDVATINIFLQDREGRKYIKVTREFNTRDQTVWKLNNNRVREKDILEAIKEFNIQVNNLCQFLPQDRVQDFAKLNKQELLKETQKALCRYDLIEKQDELIKSREQQKGLISSIANCERNLTAEQDLNSRLEGRVECFNKKKKYQEDIMHLERKIAWTIYQDSRLKLTEVKGDRDKAQEIYDKYKNALKSEEQKINAIKKQITAEQQNNTKTTSLMRNVESAIDNGLEKVENLKKSVQKVEEEMQTKLAEIDQFDKEIENAQAKLEDLKKLQEENLVKCSANNNVKEKLSAELKQLLNAQKQLQDKREELFQIKQDKSIKVRSLENESANLENIKHSRLQHLERINRDAFKAVTWLRNNKNLFEGEIYEPMMLEINVIDPRQSKYVENVIPMRDRLAFTCINKSDMNKLIKHLRESQGLSVNVIHSSGGNMNEFQPKIPIERLRKFGFYTYINNIFTAPDPIMRYLCKTYHLHNMPIGNASTNSCFEQVPNQIHQFFSDKYRYSISFSKYTGNKSSRQVEVYSDRGLSLSLDTVKLEKLKGEIQDLQKTMENDNHQCQILENQLKKIESKVRDLRDKLKDIQQEKQQAEILDTRIKTTQKKIVDLRQMRKRPDVIRTETKMKIKKHLQNMQPIQIFLRDNYKKLTELMTTNSITTLRIEVERKKLSAIENEIAENRHQCQEAEETLNMIKDKYSNVMSEAKTLLAKAKGLSLGFTPADDGFDQFRQLYDSLSDNIEELTNKKDRLENKIACLNIADDGEMREYRERQEEIKRLSENMTKLTGDLNKLSSKMNRLQDEWMVPLRELIGKINLKFASAFEKMKCAGEISICTGDNEKDFANYGIAIKVTYRNGEPLQELNSSIQSGGERAVATAAYMLSLQELTPVPFRCVDEINQGMDANNERRIFDLIVEVTCNENSSQYFLITPKLVPGLTYPPKVTVHVIHNGPFVTPDRKWGMSELCNPYHVQMG